MQKKLQKKLQKKKCKKLQKNCKKYGKNAKLKINLNFVISGWHGLHSCTAISNQQYRWSKTPLHSALTHVQFVGPKQTISTGSDRDQSYTSSHVRRSG